MRRALVLALIGCGDNLAALDAAPDATAACAATFRGNFAEQWTGPCAALDASGEQATLRFSIPSRTIAASFTIAIELGAAPGPGLYTAPSLPGTWNAEAVHEHDMTSCLYHAGTASVPPGSFTLALDAVDGSGAHGRLDVTLPILARPYTYCGESLSEQLEVSF